ncbi:O-antigen ligase family protein [Xenophilus aerolatus]|nr:O-antigen ligase family protein [Xenophilus aerolatus]
MRRLLLPRAAACLWGAVVFMPVGVNYLGFFLLLLAMLVAGDWRERAARVRQHPLWWPVMAFLVWQLAVLAFGRHYPETPVNLWHGLRLTATMLMALALTRDEAVWAARGFLAIAFFNIVYLAVFYAILLKLGVMPPMPALLKPMIMLVGNKSINNALLFTLLGAAAAAYGFHVLTQQRPYLAFASFGVTVAALVIVNSNLPSRTSLLALLLVLPAICIHHWRRRWRVLLAVLLAGAAVLAVAVWNAPPFIEQKLATGVQEIEAAKSGTVSEGSWVVRYYMYTETARMILEKPLTGWGIGAWNSEWRQRGPALLADYNMPHNDYLWMGSQTGFPGLLALLAIVLTGVWQGWKRPDLTGRIAFAAMLVLLMATSVNSALRDAQIGLSLLWIAMVCLRLAREPVDSGEPWREVPPVRWQRAA